jgi:hypothetical protein
VQENFCRNIITLIKETINSKEFIDLYKYSPSDFTRSATLNFPTLFSFLINLRRSSNLNELEYFFKQVLGTELPVKTVTDSAFSQARRKLKAEAFTDLQSQIIKAFYQNYIWKTWYGYRLVAIDGSAIKIYGDDYCKAYFGVVDNGSQSPYGLARISQCYDVLNHITLAASISPNRIGEREMALDHFQTMQNFNDLVLIDRGYPGFHFFQSIIASGRQFCARLSSGTWSSITEPFLKSGLKEQLVEYTPTNCDAIKECRKSGLSTGSIKLRLLRIELTSGEVEILITSLTDVVEYPHHFFADLYHLRWPVEEAYKTLKCRIEIENFSGESVLAVRQDFFANVFMFNVTSMLIAPIDEKLKIDKTKNKWDYKVNRTRALAKMRGFGILMLFRDSIDSIIQRLHELFIIRPTEIRPNRKFPRKNNRKNIPFAFAYKPIT